MTYQIGDRPKKLTDEVCVRVLAYVQEDLLLNNAARCAGVWETTLKDWMEMGVEDLKNDRDTFLARFYLQVREKQGLKISKLLHKIEEGTKNWQACAWKLEKCFREDFGIDADAYKKLLEDFLKMRDDVKRYTEQPLQGLVSNGKVIRGKAEENPKE